MGDLTEYFREFQNLPFERIQEKYRKQRLLSLLESYNISKKELVLEVGPGLRSLFLDFKVHGVVTVLEPIKVLAEANQVAFEKRNVRVLNQTLEEFSETCETGQYNSRSIRS